MKVWIVCDNNSNPTIRVFESLEKAQKYLDQYNDSPILKADCWIFDKTGTKVE